MTAFRLKHFILSLFTLTKTTTAFTSTPSLQITNPSNRNHPTSLSGGYDATIGIDPTTPLQLFTLPQNTCPYVQRTTIVLHELQLPFDTIKVSIHPHKPEWFLKINPRGKVPTLRVPSLGYDAVVYESGICNEFLCEYSSTTLKQDQSLMPMDPLSKANIRMWNDYCDVYAKTQFTFLMNRDETKEEVLRNEMEEALQFYEDILSKSDGVYFAGEQFTLADVHLFPFIQRMKVTLKHWKGYELPSDKFPHLLQWFDSCSERESVKLSLISEEEIIEVYKKFVGVDYKFGGLNEN